MIRKKSKNIALDKETLTHAILLANIFYGQNVSSLVTNLVNREYIEKRNLFLPEDIDKANEMVNILLEGKGNRNKQSSTPRVANNNNSSIANDKVNSISESVNNDKESNKNIMSEATRNKMNSILGDD